MVSMMPSSSLSNLRRSIIEVYVGIIIACMPMFAQTLRLHLPSYDKVFSHNRATPHAGSGSSRTERYGLVQKPMPSKAAGPDSLLTRDALHENVYPMSDDIGKAS